MAIKEEELNPFDVDAPNLRRFVPLQNDFMGVAVADVAPFTLVLLNSGFVAMQVGQAGHPGIITLSSSTTANSGCRLTGTRIDPILLGGSEAAEMVFLIPSPLYATITIRFGYLNTQANADATNGIYFEYANSIIVGKTATNSVRSTTGSYALSANKWYRLKLVVNTTASRIDFYVYDSSGTLLWTSYLTTNIPTVAGREVGFGMVATNSGTFSVPLLNLDMMAFYSTRDAR